MGCLAGAASLLLARTLVVGRADPGPGGQTLGGAEGGHVHPDLGDDRGRGQRVHAGNGQQQGLLGGEGAHGGADRRLDLGEVAPELFEAADVQAEQEALVFSELPVESEGEPVEFAPQPPLGEVGHLGGAAVPSARARSISMPETPNTLLITSRPRA